MIESLDLAVRHFRQGMDSAGSKVFVSLIDTLTTALAQSATSQQVAAISIVLGELMRAQQRSDNLFLADLLQYELRPMLADLDASA